MILWKRWGILPFFIAVMLWGVPVAAEETGRTGGVNADAAGGLPHWYLGIIGGYTNNGLYAGGDNRAFSQYERGHGFEISIPGRYRFTNWFALQAELQYIQKNYTLSRDGNYEGIYMDVTNSFIDIPVMANFSVGNSKVRGFLNAGAFCGFWVNSHRQGRAFESTHDNWDPAKTYYYDYDETVGFESERDNRFDAGLLLGIGVQYDWKPVTFFVEGRFNYGLTDLQKDYMYKQLPRINDSVVITLGVLFNHEIINALRSGK
jgi:hypothetical protein